MDVAECLVEFLLGIDLNAPKVTARIFPEKDEKLKTALEVCCA